MNQFVNQDRSYWMDVLKKNDRYLEENWEKIFQKASVEILKEFVIAVGHFFKIKFSFKMAKKWPSLCIAAKYGSLQLCKFIIRKSGNPNPVGMDGLSALHLAVQYGHVGKPKCFINSLLKGNLFIPVDFLSLRGGIEIVKDEGGWGSHCLRIGRF